jgi:hypothetical protein
MEPTLPAEQIYHAFGDGSENSCGVFYGLILIPEQSIQQIQKQLDELKIKNNGGVKSRLHCRELFHVHARKKSCWAHLSEQEVIKLCGDALKIVSSFHPKYLLSFIPREHFPKQFRLIGKNGHPDLIHEIDEKWLTLWAYHGIAANLDPVTIVTPPDYKITPKARNLPFWQKIVVRNQLGLKVSKVFLDREQTNIRWFSKTFQWITVAKELVIRTPWFESFLPLEVMDNDKHSLIDMADIFTYSQSRVFSDREIVFEDFFGEVDVIVLGHECEEIVFGENIGDKKAIENP